MKITNVVSYTPCKMAVRLDDYKYFYMMEFFRNNKNAMYDFLKGLDIDGIYKDNEKEDGIVTYNATGKNNILYVYSKNESKKRGKPENTHFCTLSKQLVDKVIAGMDPKYKRFYLDLMFDENNSEKKLAKNRGLYMETDNCIIIPNMILYYVDNAIAKPIETYKKLKEECKDDRICLDDLKKKNENGQIIDDLKNIVFEVIVKPDDYDTLKELYDEEKYLSLEKLLLEQPYKSLYHLSNLDVVKMEKVRQDIYDFYSTFGQSIKSENVKIDVNDINSNNAWISVKATYRNIYMGEYKFIRLTHLHRLIGIDHVIDMLKNNESFDGYYQRSFTPSEITNYGFSSTSNFTDKQKDCLINPVQALYRADRWTKPINEEIRSVNEKYMIRGNNNKIKLDIENIKIQKIVQNKISKNSTLCSTSVCAIIDRQYYIINVIPNTNSYVQDMWNEHKRLKKEKGLLLRKRKGNLTKVQKEIKGSYFSVLNYLFGSGKSVASNCVNYWYGKSIGNNEHIDNADTCMEYLEKNDLKYKVEFMETMCFDCEGEGECKSKENEKVRFQLKPTHILLLQDDNTSALRYHDHLKKHFKIIFPILIYNLLYVHHCLEINDISRLKDIIKNSPFLSNVVKQYENNEMYISCDYPYICIPSRSMKNKYTVWYMFLHTLKNKSELDLLMDRLEKFVFGKNMNKVVLDINDMLFICGNKFNINTYLFNIFSLYNEDGSFASHKNVLDEFLDKVYDKYRLYYYHTYFHYITDEKRSTLHLHIAKKNTFGASRISHRRNISYGKFAHEYNKYFNPLYNHINKLYFFKHYIPVYTFNTNEIKSLPEKDKDVIKKTYNIIRNDKQIEKILLKEILKIIETKIMYKLIKEIDASYIKTLYEPQHNPFNFTNIVKTLFMIII